jgi:hypothetical protein
MLKRNIMMDIICLLGINKIYGTHFCALIDNL